MHAYVSTSNMCMHSWAYFSVPLDLLMLVRLSRPGTTTCMNMSYVYLLSVDDC